MSDVTRILDRVQRTDSPQEREAAWFALAIEKPAAERVALLQAVCGEDTALQQRLEALLAAHQQPDAALAHTARTVTAPLKTGLAPEPPDEAVGQTLGPLDGLGAGRDKLLKRVGEGGGGVVYVAGQAEPVRRRVALKVIKLGKATEGRLTDATVYTQLHQCIGTPAYMNQSELT